ncbi:hypothetical protein [Flavobacterium sp. 7A]|uniref:hypothetical protein n=1 Tax=Flavobacterium sp. 7A TaxID=2940571 RepID=UPI00222720CE|nr:hypothetical protein [Flavobacterium sp. 7A]MCW2120946.1 hypothetical protein [Flavobacterium sp. 7A]
MKTSLRDQVFKLECFRFYSPTTRKDSCGSGGNFVAGEMNSCLANSDRNSTQTNPLKTDNKFFGTGGDGEFKNAAGQLDISSVKPWATYNFKAGETYTLTITGRSSKFSIDRILIADLNKYDYAKYNAYAKNAVQNECVVGN